MNNAQVNAMIEMEKKSNYKRLRAINVNDKTEKKGQLTYLSWAWAVDQLLLVDPTANWTYGEPLKFGDTMMVCCSVTVFGKTITEYLPVLDHKNKPIANPDAFAVNTAMKRCLAKGIALHGLGLYIYAGEDLPPEAEVELVPFNLAEWEKKIRATTTKADAKTVYAEATAICKNNGDTESYDAIKAVLISHGAFIDAAAKETAAA